MIDIINSALGGDTVAMLLTAVAVFILAAIPVFLKKQVPKVKDGWQRKALIALHEFFEAGAPIAIDYLKSDQFKNLPGVIKKQKAVDILKDAAPKAAKIVARKHVEELASKILQESYDIPSTSSQVRKLKSIGIQAETDGKKVGAKIKAKFKRGELDVFASGGRGMKAGIGATFNIGKR